jgi:predicted Mrr-cat superfamily restriction endonuclease
MTFVKKFNKGDEVITTQEFTKLMRGKIISGVVINDYEYEQPLLNKRGIIIGKKSGKFLHLVEFKDSDGIKHTIDADWLTRYIDPVIADAKDENGNIIYNKEERIKRFKENRAKKNASK